MNWLKNHITRDMIRPIIYKTTARLMYMLTLILLWNHFLNQSPEGLSTALALAALLFCAGFWAASMRRDGWHIPSLPSLKPRPKDRADMAYGDMIDHVDEPVVTFEELDEDEKNICLMVADIICAVIFLAAAIAV